MTDGGGRRKNNEDSECESGVILFKGKYYKVCCFDEKL